MFVNHHILIINDNIPMSCNKCYLLCTEFVGHQYHIFFKERQNYFNVKEKKF